MSKILLIAATELEIQPFLTPNTNYEVLITGVGIATSMYQIQKKLTQKSYTIAIQAGIGGEYRLNMPLTHTYFIQKDCFADNGVFHQEKFESITDINLQNANQKPFTNEWLINPLTHHLPSASGATVQLISTNLPYLNALKTKWNAHIETLEGAAMHYVCLQKNQPFIQLRSTSNYVGERNKSNWKITEALTSLYKDLEIILNTNF